MMSKFILLTDPHITKTGVDIIGLDPAIRLQSVLDDAWHNHADADAMIVMGDLVHRGSRKEYVRIKSLLAPCPMPLVLMPGNHDRRAGFSEVFDLSFGQRIIDTPTHRIICLDTLDDDPPILHAGLLCDERLSHLSDALTESVKPCIIVTHHPFGPVGFDGMDAIALCNGTQVLNMLQASEKVQLIIAGHIHRHISGSWDGLPFSILPSTCHQMPLTLNDTSSGSSVAEPAGYGVLVLKPNSPILHVAQVGLNTAPPKQDPTST